MRSGNSSRVKDFSRHNLEFEADSRFHFPWSKITQGSRVIVYGGGVVGKTFLVEALDVGYIDLVAVCDKKPKNTGIKSLPLINLDELSQMPEKNYDVVLIANEMKDIAVSIKSDLQKHGVPAEKILWTDPKLVG